MKCWQSLLGRTLVKFVVTDFLLLYSIVKPWPSQINFKAHVNTVHFERTGFLYEGNLLSEVERIKSNIEVQVCGHFATS